MSKFPHAAILADLEDSGKLPKSPKQIDAFPEVEPEGCTRGCHKFYQVHTNTISFAMYATQDPKKDPRKVCVYAFSCGEDLIGEKVELLPGETPEILLKRVVPALVRTFIDQAMDYKEDHAIRTN